MWVKKSLKCFLAISLMLCISCSSLFAWSFLPPYSGASAETGLMSLLLSMRSEKQESTSGTSETSSTETEALPVEGKAEGDKVCFTKDEVAEIDEVLEQADKELAKAEKTIADEVRKFHLGLGASVDVFGFGNGLTLTPYLDTQYRWDDWLVTAGVGYEMPLFDSTAFQQFDINKLHVKAGFMYEW